MNDHPLELFAENAHKSLVPEKVFNLDMDPKWTCSDNCTIRMVFVGGEFVFGHEAYSAALLSAAVCAAKGEQTELPNPPFAPKVKKLSISFS